jgi:hypothetical protein
MKTSLLELSDKEHEIRQFMVQLKGDTLERLQTLIKSEIPKSYSFIHRQYLTLFNSASDEKIKSETLKRIIFLNWYSITEPSEYTGLTDLDSGTIFSSYTLLDEYIFDNRLDDEFLWMLSYYSCWSECILIYSTDKLDSLTGFVNNSDPSKFHLPETLILQATMKDRGLMGIYFSSLNPDKIREWGLDNFE